MTLDYLEFIGSKNLNSFIKFIKDEAQVLPGFYTVNPTYSNKIVEMKKALESYFEQKTLKRPLVYLILGKAGTGKSYLVDCLTKSLGNKFKFQSANLSEMVDPRDLHHLFKDIVLNKAKKKSTVTFLDECDVKWEGSSALKYLINPIYDGKYWDGKKFQKIGKCAFFFAGSYLQDRETLLKIQRPMREMNLSKFLMDLYLEVRKRNDRKSMKQIRELQDYYSTYQKWHVEADPYSDVILYLRGLEKIKDFLSRVGGNTFEIIDLSFPLGITQEQFVIEPQEGQTVKPSAKAVLADIVDLIKKREESKRTFISCYSLYDSLLEYKNLLLCERLVRVISLISIRYGGVLEKKNGTSFLIDRKLLNYLTLVPLINGMRSLEQLINKLNLTTRQITNQQFDQDELMMTIHNSHNFDNPRQIWAELEKRNKSLEEKMKNNKTLNDDHNIRIPLLK
ncbi:MAG: AAA family ATPase [Candidatus Dadabacteria bacterium]|nr:AAA family ATPase [Candidatus Dadabacteria bacterium]